MKKIIYTINFLDNGGPTRVLENIVKNIDKNKYTVFIVTLLDKNETGIVKKIESSGIKIIQLNYKKNVIFITSKICDIFKTFEKINPDIIHTHGIVTSLIVSMYKTKAEKITTIHNNIHEDYRYTYGKFTGFVISELHIKLLKSFDNIIFCSKTGYDLYSERISNSSYVLNGVDVNSGESTGNLRNELSIPEDALVYVFAGAINNRKRVVELVDMFLNEANDNEYLLVIGDGQLLRDISKLSSKKIFLLGYKDNVIDYFDISNVYISNSSSEGFSISIIEALSCNLYCFLSDIQSHKECFDIDNNKYIGEVFNSSNFAEKKKILCHEMTKNDKNELSKLQQEYLSGKAMVRSYEKFYDEVMR